MGAETGLGRCRSFTTCYISYLYHSIGSPIDAALMIRHLMSFNRSCGELQDVHVYNVVFVLFLP